MHTYPSNLHVLNDDLEKIFIAFLLKVPVNNYSVMSGRSHRFLGITSTFSEVNISCSRTKHSDLSED